jgi:hypothetical protein
VAAATWWRYNFVVAGFVICRVMADSGENKTVEQLCRRSDGGFLCKRPYSLYVVEGINIGQVYCATEN